MHVFLKKLTVIIIFAFTTLCCNLSDYTKEFSNGITYIIEGGNLNGVVKKGEENFFLVPNIKLIKESEDYILFIQEVNIDFVLKNIKDDILTPNNNITEITKPDNLNFKNDDKLLKQIGCKKCFWILIKEKDSLIGPFRNSNLIKSYGFDEAIW